MSKPKPLKTPKLVERTSLPTGKIHPNPWNPNVQDPERFTLLAQSLKEEGFGEPVLVRPCPDHDDYEIVNGEHRYRLAIETQLDYVPVAVVAMTTSDAKLATIRRNKTRGGLDTLKTATLLRDMRKRMDDEEIELRLGYNAQELSELMAMLELPFMPRRGGKSEAMEQFEISVPPAVARYFDDTLVSLSGKRASRFEGKPGRKARGLVKGVSLVEAI